ncbi:DNA polymerase III subunit beta [Pseudalkalibacillus salsuginis]|uniref:DNA polymerase III subunit beta n=1 Tax=Pseudalkalibacillus salsuginis TaxID=2910972 RepID=UPI001F1EFCA5|nr:DNA polymerase III subunit beta [Pseudalkalibacillus salsuginis]MCF6410706.1 DNA polymerase III subunit beta [Pseudalkalibacillus salsuginis]
MKFIMNRDQLVDSVQDVMKAVSTRTTIPILTGIKIETHEDGVTLTGSDSDISIERFIPVEEDGYEHVEVEKSGSIVLQARFFSEIVKKLPGSKVEVEVFERFGTRIRSGSSEFNLNGLDPQEYPRLPEVQENDKFSIQADLLKTLIRQTVFAVSTSETRPILTGVNWHILEGELNCVATDSHRLASRVAAVESTTDELEHPNVVIPGKSLTELSKILDDSSALVDIVITESQVLFKAKNILFFSRLLDGNYPDTSKLIPSDSKTEMVISTKEFLQAIDRASLLAKEGRNNVVKLSTMENGQVEISSNSPEVGKVFEHVSTESFEGDELKISFSAKYMMDALKVMDCSEVLIRFTGAMRPFVLTPLDGNTIKQLILPVRTY